MFSQNVYVEALIIPNVIALECEAIGKHLDLNSSCKWYPYYEIGAHIRREATATHSTFCKDKVSHLQANKRLLPGQCLGLVLLSIQNCKECLLFNQFMTLCYNNLYFLFKDLGHTCLYAGCILRPTHLKWNILVNKHFRVSLYM